MIVHEGMEHELVRVWALISELSEQLQDNRTVTAELRAQADALKVKAIHSGTGYPLRRFNMELSKEAFEEELEKFSNQYTAENQALINDNKQLSVLVKEYEQTLESVMSKFRTHAHASQEHELAITRQYEQMMLSRETATITHELEETAKISIGLARISELLRLSLRAVGGEVPTEGETDDALFLEGMTPDVWSLERECELVRLEKENEALRGLLELRDTKDTQALREEIAKETADAYARRTTQSDSPFIPHNLTADAAGPRMFSPSGYRGLNRAARRGLASRGRARTYGVAHTGAW